MSSSAQPKVSVVIPMLNESGYIEECVRGFLSQTYPAELIEILVIDGGSTDGSREIVEEMAADELRLSVVDNPRRVAAAAANLGIERARGEVLCFLSAHGVPDPEYVATSVHLLQDTGAVGVGGRYEHVGANPPSRAVGLAMASPFGMASPHRTGTERGDVDTISHPTFWRQPMVDAGGYDEGLISNEDYEFNYRLRLAGGRLVFCPEISSVYRPRGSLRALSRQFFAYGRGKAAVLRRHPTAVRGRHLAPPIAVLGGGLLLVGAVTGRRRPLFVALAAYAAVEAAAFVRARPDHHEASTAVFLLALPAMHVSWGAGLLVGLTADALRSPPPLERDIP
jgi:succinoglycan biosynthesis protein ExoA